MTCQGRKWKNPHKMGAGHRILIRHIVPVGYREPLLRGDLVFSIRIKDWRLPRRFAPTLYASSRNTQRARCDGTSGDRRYQKTAEIAEKVEKPP